MPVQPSYPGVYIEEIESGNHTIIGVDTALTSFVGRTAMGPVGDPTPCFSFGDFETLFGGRSFDYPLSYAVEDFFQNGGSKALIVRVENATTPNVVASLPVGDIVLSASSGGTWGNSITIKVDQDGLTDQVALRFGLKGSDLFNLTAEYTSPRNQKVTERYVALTCKNKPNRIDRVLKQQSALLDCGPAPVTQAPVAVSGDTNANAAAGPPAPVAVDDAAKTNASASSTPKPAVTASPKTEFNLAPLVALSTAKALTGGTDSAYLSDTDYLGDARSHTGLYALERADLFNLLCIPWDQRDTDLPSTVHAAAASYCAKRRAIYIADPPSDWSTKVKKGHVDKIDPSDPDDPVGLHINDEAGQRNTAVYFPKVLKSDVEMGSTIEVFPACGIIAGQIATTDLNRGVWKAPAGIATGLSGITGLELNLTDEQNGVLNPLGINCLRNFRVLGPIIWGSRTLRGADLMSDDYKYLPVRRLTLFIEESLYRGTKFAVFEPNDEALWSQLRLSVGSFMADLSRQGAFYDYRVTCDKTTTTQNHIDRGIVNVNVAFAPVKPAEFVILQIQQLAGQTAA